MDEAMISGQNNLLFNLQHRPLTSTGDTPDTAGGDTGSPKGDGAPAARHATTTTPPEHAMGPAEQLQGILLRPSGRRPYLTAGGTRKFLCANHGGGVVPSCKDPGIYRGREQN
jgi:hypothetical protein